MPLVRNPPGTQPPADIPPVAAAVMDALAHGTDEQRWSAARAAAELPGCAPALAAALAREKAPRVREAIVTSLARIATPDSVAALLPCLRSDDAHVRMEATDALTAMKDAAWPYLGELLRDSDADVRMLACGLVRNMPNESAVRLLCELLESEPEPNVCAAAVDALAEIGGTEALPVLARCEQRFRATPFLAFAIKMVVDRIRAQAAPPRA